MENDTFKDNGIVDFLRNHNRFVFRTDKYIQAGFYGCIPGRKSDSI